MESSHFESSKRPRSAYEILGVDPSAKDSVLRNAWIRLNKELREVAEGIAGASHEERVAANKRLQDVNDAYDQLRPGKRETHRYTTEQESDTFDMSGTSGSASRATGKKAGKPDPANWAAWSRKEKSNFWEEMREPDRNTARWFVVNGTDIYLPAVTDDISEIPPEYKHLYKSSWIGYDRFFLKPEAKHLEELLPSDSGPPKREARRERSTEQADEPKTKADAPEDTQSADFGNDAWDDSDKFEFDTAPLSAKWFRDPKTGEIIPATVENLGQVSPEHTHLYERVRPFGEEEYFALTSDARWNMLEAVQVSDDDVEQKRSNGFNQHAEKEDAKAREQRRLSRMEMHTSGKQALRQVIEGMQLDTPPDEELLRHSIKERLVDIFRGTSTEVVTIVLDEEYQVSNGKISLTLGAVLRDASWRDSNSDVLVTEETKELDLSSESDLPIARAAEQLQRHIESQAGDITRFRAGDSSEVKQLISEALQETGLDKEYTADGVSLIVGTEWDGAKNYTLSFTIANGTRYNDTKGYVDQPFLRKARFSITASDRAKEAA